MPADELVAGLSLNLGQLELLVGVGIQVIEVDNFLTVIVGEDTLLVVGGDGNGNGLLGLFRLLGLDFLELSSQSDVTNGRVLGEVSNAGVTKLSGVSVQVASFASTLDLPTSELVAVVSLNLGQRNRIADLRQVLEADGLSTVVTNEDTLGVIGVQVNLNGLLGLFRLLGLDFLELSSQSDVANGRVLGEVSKASVTKLSGVSIQVASFASALDLPTSELVAVVSLDFRQSDGIADFRQVLEVDVSAPS